MARERRRIEEGGGGDSWLNTYADMVTLILTFFVLLFSFSNIDKEKWQQVVMSLSGGAGILNQATAIQPNEQIIPSAINLPSSSPEPTHTPKPTITPEEAKEQEQLNKEFDRLYELIMAYMRENNLEGLMEVEREDGTIVLSFKEKMLFDSGHAELKEEGKTFLTQIFAMLEGSQDSFRMLRVEGHTDNVPIRTAKYLDNWALSNDRATTVLRFIAAGTHIDNAKLSSVGYGEFHPRGDNNTEEGKAINRRVDLVCERRELLAESNRARSEVIAP